MHKIFEFLLTLLFVVPVIFFSSPAWGITFTPFGSTGEGGLSNGQTLTIGSGGEVFELDAFLRIGGMDLNGANFGSSAQLSLDALPLDLDFTFSSSLLPISLKSTGCFTRSRQGVGAKRRWVFYLL